MIEVDTATSLITTVGFPIAVCVFLLYERNKMMQDLKDIVIANTQATNELKVLIGERLK